MIGVQNRKKTKGTLKNKRSRSLFAITYKIQIIFIHSSMHSVYLFYTGVAVGISVGLIVGTPVGVLVVGVADGVPGV